jgi:hypothetical protein
MSAVQAVLFDTFGTVVDRRTGISTAAFVSRPTEHGPAQTTDLAPESDGDVVAADLVDLADRLTPRS